MFAQKFAFTHHSFSTNTFDYHAFYISIASSGIPIHNISSTRLYLSFPTFHLTPYSFQLLSQISRFTSLHSPLPHPIPLLLTQNPRTKRPKRKIHTLTTRNRDPGPRTIRIPEEPHSLLVVDDLRRLNVIVAEARVAAVSEAACGAGSVTAVGRGVGVDQRARCDGGEEGDEEGDMHVRRSRRKFM